MRANTNLIGQRGTLTVDKDNMKIIYSSVAV